MHRNMSVKLKCFTRYEGKENPRELEGSLRPISCQDLNVIHYCEFLAMTVI